MIVEHLDAAVDTVIELAKNVYGDNRRFLLHLETRSADLSLLRHPYLSVEVVLPRDEDVPAEHYSTVIREMVSKLDSQAIQLLSFGEAYSGGIIR